MKLRIGLAAAATAAALVFAGCGNDLVSSSPAQPNQLGAVTVTSTVCLFSSSTNPCGGGGTISQTGFQHLIAYLIPASVNPPATSTGTTDAAGDQRTFHYTLSSSFTTALQNASPAPDGMKWAGYISDEQDYTGAQQNAQTLTITTSFDMPQGDDGSPFQGPFKISTISGQRFVRSDVPADREVGCGPSLPGAYTSPGSTVPAPDTFCDASGDLTQFNSVDTTDFGILKSSGNPTVAAGNPVDATFNWQLAGAALSDPLQLSATTDIPGGTATPADATLTPGANGSGSEVVHLNVPASTPPGDYRITLTATLPNGQTRSQSIPVHVLAALPIVVQAPAETPGPPQLYLFGIGHQSLADALAHGVTVNVGCSEACDATITLLMNSSSAKRLHVARTSAITVAKTATSLTSAGTKIVRIKLPARVVRAIKRAGRVRLSERVDVKYHSGGQATNTHRIWLTR